MTAKEPLQNEDEVTVAAGSDVLAQIRREAQAIKRERAGESTAGGDAGGDGGAEADSDQISVWSAPGGDVEDVAVDATKPIGGFDPSLDPTVALPTNTVPPETAARSAFTHQQPARIVQPEPAATVVHVHDDGEPLIGDAPPPTPSTTYFENSDDTVTQPGAKPTRKLRRRRVPASLLVIVAVALIIGISVVIALLVASGAST